MTRYAITIFLSAFLLFLVQPLIGKYVLPWFGGGAGVWSVCLMFFQAALLLGYAYAHALTKLVNPRRQAWIHIALLTVSLIFLPIIPNEVWKPDGSSEPTLAILALLAVTIGAPFVMLAATAPLLQAWFTREFPERSPYRLYALSNAGSLLALLLFPLVLEPLTTRAAQANGWSFAFAAFAIFCGWTAIRWMLIKPTPGAADGFSAQAEAESTDAAERWMRRVLWVLLPACSVVFLLATTARITEEIAPVPLLWIIPLATYLLTFIICFEWPRLYQRTAFVVLLVTACWALAYLAAQERPNFAMEALAMWLALAVCCMICHGELYRLRPPPQRLTAYYLAIAAGGALGGMFVAFAAPSLFSSRAEYELALYITAAFVLICVFLDPRSGFRAGAGRIGWIAFAALMLGALVWTYWRKAERFDYVVYADRNFYGVLTLGQFNTDQPERIHMQMLHGRTSHGAQFANPDFRRWPTTYFGLTSGVGKLLQVPPPSPRRVGIIGLGVGTLATYGRADDQYRFYEIDPNVISMALESFTYLKDSAATVQIVQGDARLSMEAEQPQNFDLFVLDAFSGDAIPVHLLTSESFELYARHLAPNGVIAINISNRHLDLLPVVTGTAEHAGFHVAEVVNDAEPASLIYRSRWVICAKDPDFFERSSIADVARRPAPSQLRRDWTDEHASIIPILRWTR